jgi:long-subunit acyl-CoA synthetase (AMP-forming)
MSAHGVSNVGIGNADVAMCSKGEIVGKGKNVMSRYSNI